MRYVKKTLLPKRKTHTHIHRKNSFYDWHLSIFYLIIIRENKYTRSSTGTCKQYLHKEKSVRSIKMMNKIQIMYIYPLRKYMYIRWTNFVTYFVFIKYTYLRGANLSKFCTKSIDYNFKMSHDVYSPRKHMYLFVIFVCYGWISK